MALELKQNLRLSQTLVMTPQLQQAIKLLQLSRMELVDLIRTEVEQNPLLEEPPDGAENELNEAPPELQPILNQSIEASELSVEPPVQAQPDLQKANEGEIARSEIDWEQYLDNYQTQHTAPSGGSGGSLEDMPSFEAGLTRAKDLSEHLIEQLRMARLTPDEEQVGALIIGNLNRDGYLEIDRDPVSSEGDTEGMSGRCDPLLTLALQAGCSAATVEKVMKRIQRFDPIGCASRDLRECLLVQAHHFVTEGEGKDNPDAELLPIIIGKHLKSVETKKYPVIAKDLKVALDEVVAAIKLLSRLEPKPGRLYNGDEPQYITPDVFIMKVGDTYHTVLNDDGLSKLRISQHYRNALKNGGSKGAAKDFIQEKMRSAVWLIRSIHQRQRTIVKVTDSIIKFQRDFLDKGIAWLKPLILRDVAEDIGMHESTVSRVTTNKYVHTPQGIYELKFFFNSSISRVGGEDIASEAVKNQIKQIVSGEPADKPFSDQKIVEILRSQNVDIARRTVAKYREVLGILPSSKRKRYF
jgi:RNA polymerase sigma-54 factor